MAAAGGMVEASLTWRGDVLARTHVVPKRVLGVRDLGIGTWPYRDRVIGRIVRGLAAALHAVLFALAWTARAPTDAEDEAAIATMKRYLAAADERTPTFEEPVAVPYAATPDEGAAGHPVHTNEDARRRDTRGIVLHAEESGDDDASLFGLLSIISADRMGDRAREDRHGHGHVRGGVQGQGRRHAPHALAGAALRRGDVHDDDRRPPPARGGAARGALALRAAARLLRSRAPARSGPRRTHRGEVRDRPRRLGDDGERGRADADGRGRRRVRRALVRADVVPGARRRDRDRRLPGRLQYIASKAANVRARPSPTFTFGS